MSFASLSRRIRLRLFTLPTIVAACGVSFAQPPTIFQPTAVLKGHADPIYTVAVSPDGKLIATGSFDKSVKLWDTAGGKEVRTLSGKTGHQNQVLSVAFSPKGDLLASGGSDNVVKLWDIPSNTPSATFDAAAAVTKVAATADGKVYAIGTANGTIRFWNVADGKPGATLTGHAGAVFGLAFAPNGQTLMSVGADKTLRYWNPTTGQALAVVGASAAEVTGLAVNPANGTVYTASVDGQLRLWPATVTPPKPISAQPAAIASFALSGDGTLAITGSEDKAVRVVNTTTGQAVQAFPNLPGVPKPLAVSGNGQLFAAGMPDGKVHVWSADGKTKGVASAHEGAVTAVAFQLNQPVPVTAGADGVVRGWGSFPTVTAPVAHPDKITSLVALADGKRFATGSTDMAVRVLKDGAIEKHFYGHAAPVTAVAEVGGNLLTGDSSGGLFSWNPGTGQKTTVSPAGPKVAVVSLVAQPGGTGFAVVYSSGEVQFRPVAVANEKDKAQETKSLAHPGLVLAAAFTADGKKLLTVSSDQSLRTWALDTAKADAPVPLTRGAVKAAAFAADRTKVALAVTENTAPKLVVYPTAAGGKPTFEAALPGEPEALAFSANGARLAVAVVGSRGRSVQVYDVATGRPLQAVAEPGGVVRALLFLADNKTVAVAGDDKQFALTEVTVTSAIATGPGNAAALAVHPTTGQLFTAGADKMVRLWDAAGSKEAKTFGPLPAAVGVLAVSRDGQAVAAAAGKIVKIWATADGKEIPFPALAADAVSLAFSPDRTKLLVGQVDGAAWVYDLASGLPAQFASHSGSVVGVAFHPSQPVLVTAGADKTIGLHPYVLTKLVADPTAVGGQLVVTPNGSNLITTGTAPGIALWNAATPAKERTLAADGPVAAVAVSKDGLRVAVAHGAEQQVSVLTYADGSVVGRFKPSAKVAELAFHPGNAILAGRLADNRVAAWSVAAETGQPVPPEFGKPVQEFPHAAALKSLTVTPDGKFALTGAEDRQVRAWRFASDQPSASLAHPNLVDAVAFDKTGAFLATGCHDGILRIFDVSKAAVSKTINAHTTPSPQPIYSVAWTPDAKQVATASFDKTIKFWDAADGKLVREIKGGIDKLPTDPAIGKYAPVLVGALGGGYLNAPPDAGHRDQVFCLAFTADGKLLASGSSDRTLKLWDPATGQLVRDFPNPTLKAPPPGQPHPSHPGFVHVAKFTADGAKLVSAGTAPRGQGYLAVWNVADGRLLAAQELAVGPIYSLDLTAAGIVLGCGPKARFQSESEAVVVPLPK